MSRTAVWATTPIVENPATRMVWKDPQLSIVWGLAALAPMMAMNMPSPAIATTLLTIGAHIAGPKAPWAFRTWVSRAYRP